MSGDLTDVAGVRVGHWSDAAATTGTTVVLLPEQGATAAVDVRGAAPGTRETDLLGPDATVGRAHALVLTGGSAYGLAAADGVVRRLEERGVGYPTPAGRVPIVPAAVLYDLTAGGRRPDAQAGYDATLAAELGAACGAGRVGAGTGASVGKLLGSRFPGGLGTASHRLPGGGTVGAVVAVNAVGDVVAEDGSVLAGGGAVQALLAGPPAPPPLGTSTTLAVLATDLSLGRRQVRRLAALGHDGFARAIRPVHTAYDGDAVFAVATGTSGRTADEALLLQLQVAAVEVLVRAIRSAVS